VLAKDLRIPWYIFSDGEENAANAVNSCLKKLSIPLDTPRFIKIPDGKNFEKYIANDVYKSVLIDMIIEANADNERHKEALRKEWQLKSNPLEAIASELKKDKTKYGKLIAEAITSMPQEELRFPAPIRKLFEEIAKDFDSKKLEATI